MEKEIVNRVEKSNLVQIDLDDLIYDGEVDEYDLKENLHEGLILREKDFRQFLASHDWSKYSDRYIAVYCSVDAIIPNWVYMLLASRLGSAGAKYRFGSPDELRLSLLKEKIDLLNTDEYMDRSVIVKGCGKIDLSPDIYMMITAKLQPIVKSLMFGEACSTVPVYKKGHNDPFAG